MIIKLRTMTNGDESWSIISDIEKVDYREIRKKDRQHERFNPDYYVQMLDINGKVDEGMQDYIYAIAFRKKDIVSICSNMVIYLLNDEGKTIERIN